jgi:uncharacterized membrane protein
VGDSTASALWLALVVALGAVLLGIFTSGAWEMMTTGAWVWMLVPLVMATAGACWLLTSGTRAPREDPLEVAQRRFASGEITPQEFERLVAALRPRRP